MALFAMPEFWVGGGLLLVIAVVLLSGDKDKKKLNSRLNRISHKGAKATTITADSLRRRDPNAGSALGQRIAGFNSIEKLRGRMEMAGMKTTPQRLLAYMAGIFFGILFVVVLMLGKSPLIGLLLALLASLALPHLVINRKLHKRKMAFLKLFPEAIELIVRGLRAGLPVAESFITVSRELPPPMGDTFAIISQQTSLGVPMEKALADAAARIDLTEFNFFVTTIILQRETGGNLGEILNNLADMLRGRQMMKLKIGALSSEARASAYIVGALPFVVFGILSAVSPKYLDPLYNDYRGNMAVLAAFGLMGLGGFIMKRMTALEI